MNDINLELTALLQHATGEITYNTPVGADYADGTITITDYTQLIEAAATGTIQIVDYSQLSGATITVDGVDYVEGVDFTAETSNDVTAGNLATAIDGGAQGAAAVTDTVTVTAATAGEAGNSIDLATSDATNAPVSGATLTGGQDHASFTLNGTTVVQGTDFNAASDNDTTASNLATALDAATNVSAAAVGAVVTATADARGTTANAYVFTQDVTGGSSISGSGTLAGGVNGDTVLVDGTTCTCVVGTAGANEFSDITELEALVEAVSGVNSTEDGTTVSITADAPGTAGNAITLALGGSNAGDMAISGATLTGGVASSTSDVFDTYDDEGAAGSIAVIVDIDSKTGTPSLVITPQVSTDKVNWIDRDPLPALTATGVTEKVVREPMEHLRFKYELTGTGSPTVTGTIKAVPSKDIEETPGAFTADQVDVPSAGTAVQLSATSVPIESVIIKALAGNSGMIYVGGSDVDSSNGFELDAGESMAFDFNDLSEIWVDTSNSGDDVCYFAVKKA